MGVQELSLYYDGKDGSTFFSRAHLRGYNPDLCIASCDSDGVSIPVKRSVLSAYPGSQHRPVAFAWSVPKLR